MKTLRLLCSLFLVSAFVTVFFSGCAGMHQAYQDQVCNHNGGYQSGMNDARAGKPMDQWFGHSCDDPGARTAAIQGYQEGYNSGLASTQSGAPVINFNFGSPQANRFYCEIHAFTETFSAWGGTELEARVNAKNKCTTQYNEMHCNDISCHQ